MQEDDFSILPVKICKVERATLEGRSCTAKQLEHRLEAETSPDSEKSGFTARTHFPFKTEEGSPRVPRQGYYHLLLLTARIYESHLNMGNIHGFCVMPVDVRNIQACREFL